MAETERVGWVGDESFECVAARQESVEPASFGADPDIAGGVLEQRPDPAGRQRGRVLWVVTEHGEVVAVVPVQPILGAEPQEPLTVLKHRVHRFLGQPVFDGQMPETDVGGRLTVRGDSGPEHQDQGDDPGHPVQPRRPGPAGHRVHWGVSLLSPVGRSAGSVSIDGLSPPVSCFAQGPVAGPPDPVFTPVAIRCRLLTLAMRSA